MPTNGQGVDSKRFLVSPRTLIFIFDETDRILLLKGAAHKRLWAGKYNGLGGHVEHGEDILESAQRELQEESGLVDVALQLCGQIMVTVDRELGVAVFIFKGYIQNQPITASDEGSLAWVNLEEIEGLLLVEDLTVLLPKVAAYKPGDPLIIAKEGYTPTGQLLISFN